ncbi:MAG TPA: multidrug ABC transporter [Lachnospiraceae bacterium]|nr:multidrug ABC transporter [Lachnospiraceae bacterium]
MNTYYLILILSVILASSSQILLKMAAKKKYPNHLQEYLNPLVITGYGLTFVSMFLTILSYRGLAYKNVPIMESIGFIIVMILGRIIFKEKLSIWKISGTCIILAGICIYYL